MRKRVKVKVEVFDEYSRMCLREIRGLKQGDVVEGVLDSNTNAVDFKWNGEDAVLWLGGNCDLYHGRKKAIDKPVIKK